MVDLVRSALLGLALASTLAGCSSSDGGQRCGAQTCTTDQYCVDDLHRCGASAAASLHCEQIPEVCPAVVLEVCGCDGKTYPSLCDAATRGVDVADPSSPCVTPGG